jgi:hypothetical protein
MFSPVSLSRRRPAVKAAAFLFVVLCFTALSVLSCNLNGNDEFVDDHKLNQNLIGTWSKDFGGGFVDTYVITVITLSHTSGFPVAFDASPIRYIYNFSETAGCFIVQRDTDNKFAAVYYKDLKSGSIIIGDAYNAADYSDPAVDTLEEAKKKFAPENRDLYGGDLAAAAPILKQP